MHQAQWKGLLNHTEVLARRILQIHTIDGGPLRHRTQSQSSSKLPRNRNAGTTAVTAVNSLHLAIFYAINAKNPAHLRNLFVIAVGPNLLEKQHAMDIWLTTNANQGTARPKWNLHRVLDGLYSGLGRFRGIAWKG